MSNCTNTVVIDNREFTNSGPYVVTPNSPNVGDVTVLDQGTGYSFTIPAPLLCILTDCDDKDTRISMVESGGANGGDSIEIKIDGVDVGRAEFIGGHASGYVKWTFEGIVDPIVYHGQPIGTAVRNALPNISRGYLIYNDDIDEYQYWNGTVWKDFSATEIASANNGLSKPSGDIELGGTLYRSTEVDGVAFDLSFKGTGTLSLGDITSNTSSAVIAPSSNSILLRTEVDPNDKGEFSLTNLGLAATIRTSATELGGLSLTPGQGKFTISNGNESNTISATNNVSGLNPNNSLAEIGGRVSGSNILNAWTLRRTAQFSPAVVGMGISSDMVVETSFLNPLSLTRHSAKYDNVTGGSESASYILSTLDGGAVGDRLTVNAGGVQLNDYGGGTITGTALYGLAVDASGNIVEETLGLSGKAYDSLVDGNFSAQVKRLGGSLSTLNSPATGEYDITIQSGGDIESIDIIGDLTILDVGNLIIRVDNSANSRDRVFNIQVYNLNNGALVNIHQEGIVPTQPTPIGNITVMDFSNMTNLPAAGYRISLR